MDTKQPEALRIADAIATGRLSADDVEITGRELRRLHTENEQLRAGYDATRHEIANLQERVQELGKTARDVNSRRVQELEAQLEAHQLHGDAKLAHDQCRAVVSLASSVAEVYAARAAIVEHDNSLADLIGYASAAAMEWLGDELNAMDAAEEEDEWIDPIFDAAQERWPQPSPALPDAREKLRTDVARAIWEVMREYEDSCDLALEDLGSSHQVWFCADAAIAAQQGEKS